MQTFLKTSLKNSSSHVKNKVHFKLFACWSYQCIFFVWSLVYLQFFKLHNSITKIIYNNNFISLVHHILVIKTDFCHLYLQNINIAISFGLKIKHHMMFIIENLQTLSFIYQIYSFKILILIYYRHIFFSSLLVARNFDFRKLSFLYSKDTSSYSLFSASLQTYLNMSYYWWYQN